jgi:surface polysaccharide O-acyltransferase-like enzyme
MSERIHSLDTVKGVALLAIFLQHARWMYVGSGGEAATAAGFIIMNITRLAVPLFFLTSGYLLYMKLSKLDTESGKTYIQRYLKKIGTAYLAGTALFYAISLAALEANKYLQMESITYWVSMDSTLPQAAWSLLYQGIFGAEHLWFLTALFYSALMIYVAQRYGYFTELFALSGVLHVVGILSQTYLVLDQIPVPPDDAVFFGLFFTAAGYYINKKNIKEKPPFKYLVPAAILVNVLHLVERYIITTQLGYEPYFWNSYSFLTFGSATLIFLYTLKRTDLGRKSFFNKVGQKTLWIYVLHPLGLGAIVGATILSTQQVPWNPESFLIVNVVIAVVGYIAVSAAILKYKQSDFNLRQRLGIVS